MRKDNRTKHGMYKTPEYKAYSKMKSRCACRTSSIYKDYGGRGISVCDSWMESFENFYSDMGKRPSPRHSIDRVDNDKGYSPENCRWATTKEQTDNKRSNKVYTVNGITDNLSNLCAHMSLDRRTVYSRIRRGLSLEEAFCEKRVKRVLAKRAPVFKNTITGFKGVIKRKCTDKFDAVIYLGGKLKHIGRFTTKEEAAIAYNNAAKDAFGDKAWLNEVA